MQENRKGTNALVGLAVIGSAVTGVAGFIGALFPFLSGDFLSAGVCVAAAGLSFGLLANALLRQ